MEIYHFSAWQIQLANRYNTIAEHSAANHAARIVLNEVANSPENVETSGGFFREAKEDIEWGLPRDVERMYEVAYSMNTAYIKSSSV